MRSRAGWLPVLALVAAACVGGGEGEKTEVGEGRLVIVDGAGEVVTLARDGSDRVTITDDAGEGVVHFQPVWGGERLAWGEITDSTAGLGLARPDGSEPALVETEAPVFYQYWSPDGDRVATLHNSVTAAGSLDLEVVDVAAGEGRVVAQGSPLYFSWSPDGERMAAHIGGSDLVGVGLGGEAEDLGATLAGYQAPVWRDDGIVHLGPSGLELVSAAGEATPLAEVEDPILFVSSPDGDRIAVQSYAEVGATEVGLGGVPALPPGRLSVLDLAAGTVTPVSAQLTAGFFWSPDGRSLLVLVPEERSLRIRVWADGESRDLGVIEPAPGLVERMLLFFDQYAQSLRVWSPDSSAVALPGSMEGRSGIWLLSGDGSEPEFLGEGSWVSWSPG